MQFRLIRLDRSPNWYVTWTEGGSRYVSTRTADRKEAEAFLLAFRLEYSAPEEISADRLTVAAVLDDYFLHHASKLASGPQAKIALKHLKGFFGASPVSAITPHAHERYAEHRAGVSNDTINRERMVLRAALNRAVKMGWLRFAPDVPTLEANAPRERFMSRTEAGRLLWAARRRPHLAMFIRLGLYTGARPGAILDLTWDRVDFENGLIEYPLPKRTTGRKRRATVPFMGALARALRCAKARAKTDHVVEYQGEPVKGIKKAFRTAVAAAGLSGVVRYTLRHTAASWAIKAVPAFEVAKMLGNRVAMVEKHYAKLAPEYLQGAVLATTRGIRNNPKVRPPDPPPDVGRPPESPVSPGRMVGATGIEPVTPTMSRIGEAATELIGAAFSFSANSKNAPQFAGTSPGYPKVSDARLRLVPGRIEVPAAANDGPAGPPPSPPASGLMRKR